MLRAATITEIRCDDVENTHTPSSIANPTITAPNTTHVGRRRFGADKDTTDPIRSPFTFGNGAGDATSIVRAI
jgi:hypothetical protein